MCETDKKPENKKESREIDEFKIGTNDPSGYQVTKIFSKGDEYAIYEINSNIASESIKVLINPENKNKFIDQEKNYEKIKSEVNELKAVLYKCKRDNSFKHLIAAGISSAIVGDIEGSKKILGDLLERINKEYRIQFKNKIIYSSVSLVILIFLLNFSYQTYKVFQNTFLHDNPIIQLFIYSATAGAIGGFLALSIKLKKIEIESDLKPYKFVFYGLERIFLSLLNSIVIVIAIKSGLFLGFINEIETPMWGYLFFSIIAGYSETFIPDILTKIEKENK